MHFNNCRVYIKRPNQRKDITTERATQESTTTTEESTNTMRRNQDTTEIIIMRNMGKSTRRSVFRMHHWWCTPGFKYGAGPP